MWDRCVRVRVGVCVRMIYTVVYTWNRNGSKLAAAYSEAETKKATIKLLRCVYIPDAHDG